MLGTRRIAGPILQKLSKLYRKKLMEPGMNKLVAPELRQFSKTISPAFRASPNKPQKAVPKTEREIELEKDLPAAQPAFGNRVLSCEEAVRRLAQRTYNLVSIDIEMFERVKGVLTEIGISMYNPSYQMMALFPQTLNEHIIIKENMGKFNGRFVPDCKMKNITSQSVVASIPQAQQALATIFDRLGPNTCIVGHGVKGDIKILNSLGFDIPAQCDIIDTQLLWYALHGTTNIKSSLSFILEKLSIPHAFLHNGANDAYYTLMACLQMGSVDLFNHMKVTERVTDRERQELIAQIDKSFGSKPKDEAKIERRAKKRKEMIKNLPRERVRIRYEPNDKAVAEKNLSNKRSHYNPPQNTFYPPADFNKSRFDDLLNDFLR